MASTVVGFDVGSLTSYIAAAKGGGIEVLANELCDRCTPSCVAFNGASRYLGSAAEQQMITNISNTVCHFSRLIGKMECDPVVEKEREFSFYEIVPDNQGRAAIKLTVNGVPTVLLPEQILAMHLYKLSETSEQNLGCKVVDVVLSVPAYYTDRERRAFIDASRIAGLNCMRLVSETTAIAIAYGLTKKDLPAADQTPRNVAFVSLGNSNLQVSIVSFNMNKMKVISTACDPCVGGRDFDMCIFNQLIKEIENKYKLKVMKNVKARVRLLKSCERLKKMMSANSTEIPINVECLMEDTDISLSMKREFFESLCENLLGKIKNTMEKALASSNLKLEDLHSVELVGGSTRIPCVKKLVNEVFGKNGSTTLNADEAVARGCAFQAAICSPAFKVREFGIVDACPYSIFLHSTAGEELMESVNDDEVSDFAKCSAIEVFKHLSNFPFSKQIKFNRKSDFTVTASYSNPNELHISDPVIGSFKITNVYPTPPDTVCQVRIKVRVNSNGIFTISNAVVMDRVEKEVEVPIEEPTAEVAPSETKMDADPKMEAPASNETDEVKSDQPPPSKPKTKTEIKMVLRPRDVPVVSSITQLSSEQLLEFMDFNAKLNQSDAVERDRQHLKNALEAYVYEMRDKLETCLLQHTTETERSSFKKALNETEDWIYESEDAAKSSISQRLEGLKQIGDRFSLRYSEFECRGAAITTFSKSCEAIQNIVDSYVAGEPTYDHLSKEDITKIETAVKEKQNYLHKFLQTVEKLHPTSDPSVFSTDLSNARKELENICNPIISKPKPAPPPPPPSAVSTENGTDPSKTTNADGKVAESTKTVNDLPDSGEGLHSTAAGENMDVD